MRTGWDSATGETILCERCILIDVFVFFLQMEEKRVSSRLKTELSNQIVNFIPTRI